MKKIDPEDQVGAQPNIHPYQRQDAPPGTPDPETGVVADPVLMSVPVPTEPEHMTPVPLGGIAGPSQQPITPAVAYGSPFGGSFPSLPPINPPGGPDLAHPAHIADQFGPLSDNVYAPNGSLVSQTNYSRTVSQQNVSKPKPV